MGSSAFLGPSLYVEDEYASSFSISPAYGVSSEGWRSCRGNPAEAPECVSGCVGELFAKEGVCGEGGVDCFRPDKRLNEFMLCRDCQTAGY